MVFLVAAALGRLSIRSQRDIGYAHRPKRRWTVLPRRHTPVAQ
jgi:hypothetical protein